jgi:hypothetical protein
VAVAEGVIPTQSAKGTQGAQSATRRLAESKIKYKLKLENVLDVW